MLSFMRSLNKISNRETEFQVKLKNIHHLLQRNSVYLNNIFEDQHITTGGNHTFYSEMPTRHFYQAVCGWMNSEASSVKLLYLFDRLIASLHNKVTANKREYIIDTFDAFIKSDDSDFRQFLGLILALDNYLDRPEYLLVSVAAPCNNSHDAEFFVSEVLTGEKRLIEVINVRIDDQIIASVSDFTDLMKTTLSMESFNKGNGLESYFTTIHVPVVWSSIKRLREISSIFKQSKGFPSLLPAVEPLSWLGICAGNGVVVKYGAISQLTKSF